VEPIGCPEVSVNNYQKKMRNIPEERRPLGSKFSFVGLEIGCDNSDGTVRQIITGFEKTWNIGSE
jgi:hypothetical protein